MAAESACVAYLGVGGLLLRMGLAARAGRSSVRFLGVLMWGTPDQLFLGIRALRRRQLARVMALGVSLFFPIGTVAGVFTFVVLGGPTVRATYGEKQSPNVA